MPREAIVSPCDKRELGAVSLAACFFGLGVRGIDLRLRRFGMGCMSSLPSPHGSFAAPRFLSLRADNLPYPGHFQVQDPRFVHLMIALSNGSWHYLAPARSVERCIAFLVRRYLDLPRHFAILP